jgi:hypothetical protein
MNCYQQMSHTRKNPFHSVLSGVLQDIPARICRRQFLSIHAKCTLLLHILVSANHQQEIYRTNTMTIAAYISHSKDTRFDVLS